MVLEYAIIGAGPAGSYLAKKLALRGVNVSVFEKNKDVGVPVQCTGLLTSKIKEFVSMNKEFVVNRTSRVRLHSKNVVAALNSDEYVVNRTLFDRHLMNEAVKCGVKYYLEHNLESYNVKNGLVELVFENGAKVVAEKVIGCDGPLSKVNSLFKMNGNNRCFFGKQFVVKTENVDNSVYDAFFEEKYRDFFAWSVPCSDSCLRVGLGSSNASVVNKRLDDFLKVLRIKGKTLDVNAGLIPIYDPERVCFKEFGRSKIYLMGDAAGIVKASSGGGIIPSFQMINESYKYLLEGEKLRFPKTRFELLTHYVVHEIMARMSDSELDDLMGKIKDKDVARLFSKTSRDSIIKLLFELIIKKPEMLGLSKYLLKLL